MQALGHTATAWPYRAMPSRTLKSGGSIDAFMVGLALKLLRERAGLTQEEAAAKIGATQQTWQRYEAGRSAAVLRLDNMAAAAAAVGSNPEALVALAQADVDKIVVRPQATPQQNDAGELPVWGRGIGGSSIGPGAPTTWRSRCVHDPT